MSRFNLPRFSLQRFSLRNRVPTLPPFPQNERPAIQYDRIFAQHNPFRVEKIHALSYQFLQSDWDTLWQRCQEMNFRGALVGMHGHGKTTLQMEIAKALEELGHATSWLKLSQEAPRFPAGFLKQYFKETPHNTFLFLDGAEQLSWFAWRQFLKQAAPYQGLIITIHKQGRMKTLLQCDATLELLNNLVHQLAPHQYDMLKPKLPRLFEWSKGNTREALRELYNWAAEGRISNTF